MSPINIQPDDNNKRLSIDEVYNIVDRFIYGLHSGGLDVANPYFVDEINGAAIDLMERYELFTYELPFNKRNSVCDISLNGLKLVELGGIRNYLEYKKQQERKPNNNITIHGNNYGVATQDSETILRDFQPTINPPIVQKIDAAKQGIITSVGKWILNNIITVIISGLILAFIVYKLRWN